MSKRTTSMLKGIGIGMALCAMAVEGCKMLSAAHSSKARHKRCRLKQDTGRAMRAMGDVIEDVECMFHR